VSETNGRENGASLLDRQTGRENGGLSIVAQETGILPAFLPSSGGENLDSREQASSDARVADYPHLSAIPVYRQVEAGQIARSLKNTRLNIPAFFS